MGASWAHGLCARDNLEVEARLASGARRRGAERHKPSLEPQRQRYDPGIARSVVAIEISKKRVAACLALAGTLMRQRGVHQRNAGTPVKLGKRHLRESRASCRHRLADSVLLPGHKCRAELRRLALPEKQLRRPLGREGHVEGPPQRRGRGP